MWGNMHTGSASLSPYPRKPDIHLIPDQEREGERVCGGGVCVEGLCVCARACSAHAMPLMTVKNLVTLRSFFAHKNIKYSLD